MITPIIPPFPVVNIEFSGVVSSYKPNVVESLEETTKSLKLSKAISFLLSIQI